MRVHIKGLTASKIISHLGSKKNDPRYGVIHGATVEGHEPVPFTNTFSVKTGKEPLIPLPAGSHKCKVYIEGHQIAKLTRGEPTQVYDMEPENPGQHFACQDHYETLLTLDQLKYKFFSNRHHFSFVATDLFTTETLFEKQEEE